MDREIPAEVKKQKMLKRLLRLAVTGTAATAALLILSRVLGNDLHENELFIRKVDRGPIEISVSASGKLMPLQEEIIVTPINTRILEVYKNPGDSVDEGDPLLKLELASVETEYRQKLDEREMMKSKLEQARVRLNGTISELEMQRRVKSMQAKQLYTDLQDERYLDSIGAGQDPPRRTQLRRDEARTTTTGTKDRKRTQERPSRTPRARTGTGHPGQNARRESTSAERRPDTVAAKSDPDLH